VGCVARSVLLFLCVFLMGARSACGLACRCRPREEIYTLEQLERGRTRDPYWNAAQLEMVCTGAASVAPCNLSISLGFPYATCVFLSRNIAGATDAGRQDAQLHAHVPPPQHKYLYPSWWLTEIYLRF
jgi:hypothetical protein